MWLERFVIIVPTLTRQRMPVEGAFYIPNLGGMVDPGRLHLFIHAPLYPLHKSLSNRSYLGNQRRQGESRDRKLGKGSDPTFRSHERPKLMKKKIR